MLSFALATLVATQSADANPRSGIRAGICVGMDPSCVYSGFQFEYADPSLSLGASIGSHQVGVNGRVYLFPRSKWVRPHLSFGVSTDTDGEANTVRSTENGDSSPFLTEPDLIVAPGLGIDYHFGPGGNFILRPQATMGLASMNDTLYEYVGGSVSLMVHFDGRPTKKRRRYRRHR